MKTPLAVLAVGILATTFAQDTVPVPQTSSSGRAPADAVAATIAPPPLATLPNTEVHLLRSRFVDQEFEISVALPSRYSQESRAYPVVYAPDANRGFLILAQTARLMETGGELPALIVVGIGYRTSLAQFVLLRTRDLTPTRDEKAEQRMRALVEKETGERLELAAPSGGAAQFLRFLREELTPFIDSHYRTEPADRALFGYSLGGLFAAYVLTHEPEAFSRYIAGSPTLIWDGGVILRDEAAYAAGHSDLPARVFLSYGGLEPERYIQGIDRFAGQLKSRGHPSLKLTSQVFADETHNSCPPAAISRGLRVVYDRMPPPPGK